MCMCVCLSADFNTTCLQVPVEPRRTSDPLELEFQAVVIWVLGTEPGTSARAASALNH